MEIKDCITFLAILIAVAGWFINGKINRNHEIFKKALDSRIESLYSYLNVYLFIQKNNAPFTDPSFLPLLEKARSNIQLYGKIKEIDLSEKFIQSCEKKDINEANINLNNLTKLLYNTIRKQLRIKK